MEVKMPKEAESIVDKWIHQNRRRVLGVNYHSVLRKGDTWQVKGEVEIKTGLFSTRREEFSMSVDARTGEIKD
jgi:hypothetical protein